MLYIHYKHTENMVWGTGIYFNNTYQDDWMKDAFVKEMIRGVDKSEVVDVDCVRSPVLGMIPITKISQGVKTLILMYKDTEHTMWATACGDNCAEWIIQISERQDLHIVLEHIMHFPRDFEAICVDNGRHIKSESEYMDNAFDVLYCGG